MKDWREQLRFQLPPSQRLKPSSKNLLVTAPQNFASRRNRSSNNPLLGSFKCLIGRGGRYFLFPVSDVNPASV